MDIKLEADVFTTEGDKVGTVDRVVIHPDSMEIEAIIVEEGTLFTKDRIVEAEFIDHVDSDGNVHLKISHDQEEDLPTFAEERFTHPSREQASAFDNIGVAAGPGSAGRLLVASEPAGYRDTPAPDTFMGAASPDPAPMEQKSNLAPGTVSISEGTDVIDSNGDKVGAVHDIIYGDDGEIEAFLVEEGFIFKEQVRVPIEWVTGVAHDHVVLNRTAQQVEQEGRYS